MYKTIIRRSIRRNLERLAEGDPSGAVARFHPDAELWFPGNSSWATQKRANEGPTHSSHRGRSEIEEFVDRYRAEGMKMRVEDILVNGPPWNMRAAVRVEHTIPPREGLAGLQCRGMLYFTSKWGKVLAQEDYEDTEALADYDARFQAAAG